MLLQLVTDAAQARHSLYATAQGVEGRHAEIFLLTRSK
jgi:hypothetical protein